MLRITYRSKDRAMEISVSAEFIIAVLVYLFHR